LSHDYIEMLRGMTVLEDVQLGPLANGLETAAVLLAESVPHEPV